MQADSDGNNVNTEARLAEPRKRRLDVMIAGLIVVLALAFFVRGWYASSRPVTQRAAVLTPPATGEANQGFDQYTKEGLQYYQAKDYPRAEQAFRKAIEVAPTNALGYNNLGSVLNDEGRFDESIPVLQKALSINPNLGVARNNLAWALDKKAGKGK